MAHEFLLDVSPAAIQNLRSVELSLAYEHAGSLIETSCLMSAIAGLEPWFDLSTSEIDLSDEIAYLDSRRLLMHHPTIENLVQICDEDEPVDAPCDLSLLSSTANPDEARTEALTAYRQKHGDPMYYANGARVLEAFSFAWDAATTGKAAR